MDAEGAASRVRAVPESGGAVPGSFERHPEKDGSAAIRIERTTARRIRRPAGTRPA